MNKLNKIILLTNVLIALVLPVSADSPIKYSPDFGMGTGSVSLDDSQFYDIPTESCSESTTATIEAYYFLTEKLYLLKTTKGYLVASLEISLRDIETGMRRSTLPSNASCKLDKGLVIEGQIDCLGARVVKKSPYDNCGYDIKVWSHSIPTKELAFEFIYKKLQEQFIDYREQCTIIPKSTVKDRMLKF